MLAGTNRYVLMLLLLKSREFHRMQSARLLAVGPKRGSKHTWSQKSLASKAWSLNSNIEG